MAPYYPQNYTGCINGCDHNFKEMLGFRQSRPNSGKFHLINDLYSVLVSDIKKYIKISYYNFRIVMNNLFLKLWMN